MRLLTPLRKQQTTALLLLLRARAAGCARVAARARPQLTRLRAARAAQMVTLQQRARSSAVVARAAALQEALRPSPVALQLLRHSPTRLALQGWTQAACF